MHIVYELLCILFFLATGVFCVTWPVLRAKLPWQGRRWLALVVSVVAVLLGAWHLLFGALKLLWLVQGEYYAP